MIHINVSHKTHVNFRVAVSGVIVEVSTDDGPWRTLYFCAPEDDDTILDDPMTRAGGISHTMRTAWDYASVEYRATAYGKVVSSSVNRCRTS